MDDTQLLRYSRHILLNELGVEGQEKIRAARVLLVGSGGLGSPAALYLAAAGIGHMTLCDGDVVDLTNLQRQVALRLNQVGQNKALATRETLRALNPEVEVQVIPERLSGNALTDQVAAVDVVLDCSDNFATRHAVNRAAVQHAKPLVSGAAIRFDAQVAVFDSRAVNSPCYACLYPETAVDEELRCAVMGVFSPLVGIVGAMQAAEALKLVAGMGRSLAGRLLILDALSMEWQQLKLPRDPHCKVCAHPRA